MMSAGEQVWGIGWRGRILALIGVSVLALAISLGASVARAGAAVPKETDIMIIFDTSGSMQGVLDEAKEEIKTLVAKTEESLPNVEFGVANVEDIPGYFAPTLEPVSNKKGEEVSKLTETEYEEDPEKPWHLWQPLTSNEEEVEKAINGLSSEEVAHYGGDGPEAYGRALYETATNKLIGWRPGARHEIVMIADNVPHTPNVNENIPSEFWLENPFDTGEELPGTWGIPGTTWKEPESLEFHHTLHKLDEESKPLAMVDYFHTGESEEVNYIHYWEYWAAEAGGQAITVEEGTKSLDAKLLEIIKESSEGIPPCPPGTERTPTTPCKKKPVTVVPPPPPPPPPPVPNSGFTIQSIVSNANGTVTITFVPTQSGTGTVVVTVPTASIASTSAVAAKAKKPKKCKTGQVKIKGKCRPSTTVAGTTTATGTAGVPLTLTVTLSSKIKALLKKGKTVHLVATLTYTSSLGGTPTVSTYNLTIKGKRPHRHK
jgi:hypothetical protein